MTMTVFDWFFWGLAFDAGVVRERSGKSLPTAVGGLGGGSDPERADLNRHSMTRFWRGRGDEVCDFATRYEKRQLFSAHPSSLCMNFIWTLGP